MISNKKSVQYLKQFSEALELFHWVFSPGSRNAPIVMTIANDPKFDTLSIVDERSAAFIALGQSIRMQKPSVICCTSGSASLNYAPAISEAFYQEIPLFVVTADRPQKWIGNGEGQSIDQVNVYQNYCLSSYHINEEDSEEEIEAVFKSIAKDLTGCRKGPVHLNIAFEEPLYNKLESDELPLFVYAEESNQQNEIDLKELDDQWKTFDRIMILVGQHQKDDQLSYWLRQMLFDKRVVVLTENLSNVSDFHFVNCIDRTLPPGDLEDFHPQLVITLGGAIVSKKVKQFLRNIPDLKHWHISSSGTFPNVFECLEQRLKIREKDFLKHFVPKDVFYEESQFQNMWVARSLMNKEKHLDFVNAVGWSDFKAHAIIHDSIPDGFILHQGNSSVVRYYQLFDPIDALEYHGNRGVSGIDGSMSTALGYSRMDSRPNIFVSGDLSFVYDNNALWNKISRDRMLIIVINNGGGGIFRIIPGPASTQKLDSHFEVGNPTQIKHLAAAHQINYSRVENEQELEQVLTLAIRKLLDGEFDGEVVEVFTPGPLSAEILKQYFTSVNG